MPGPHRALTAPSLEEVREAAGRIAGAAVRTPLVRLNAPGSVYLKLENLQPIGSFKIRSAANAMAQVAADELAHGVWTSSAGNMGQGVAWCARRLGLACTVVVPESAPATKLEALQRLGARVVPIPYDDWMESFRTHSHPEGRGHFIHPFSDRAVMAGNGTIGLEILADLAEVETIILPYGGGGLAAGVAAAVRAVKPSVRVYACEVSGAAPLAAALAAGHPVPIQHARSFVDGMGGPSVFPEMFALARELLAGSLAISADQVADAVRLLVERNRIVAEGAGAAPVAAALWAAGERGATACVVSGGNLDSAKLALILQGRTP